MISRKQIAIKAVITAGKLCQHIQTEMVSSDAIQKSDRSPVTVADFGSQALICKAIGDILPEDVIVAEENAKSLRENDALLNRVVDYVKSSLNELRHISPEMVCEWIDRGSGDISDGFWTLDPIDGTKGFLRRDQYAIALAWVENGVVQLGVLGCPNLPHQLKDHDSERGCLFVASRGEGASIYTLTGELIEEIHISDEVSCLAESFESTHGDTDTHSIIANKLGLDAPPVRIDSQAKYGVLARGEASLYIRLPNPASPDYRECIWDHAAGMLVVEEAGGIVTDAEGKPLNFLSGRRMTENRGVIATTKILHKQVLSVLTSLS